MIQVEGLTKDYGDFRAVSEISFEVEVETSGEKMILKCQGRVVLTEAHGRKTSVAVKITQSIMEAVS